MLEFTGERYVPSERGELRYEHLHRYAIAAELTANRTVLDIACGEGYGAALLARRSSSVIGVDIDSATIAHARAAYAGINNLSFQTGDATAIPLADSSVDSVVSFETIEHLSEQSRMISEIRRVLRADGLLIISSPNRDVYTGEREFINEHHVRELDFQEFNALLREQFAQRRFLGQRFLLNSAIVPLEGALDSYRSLIASGDDVQAKVPGPERIMYLMAVCGGDAAAMPDLAASLFSLQDEDLYAKQAETLKWAASVHQELEESQRWAATVNAKLATVALAREQERRNFEVQWAESGRRLRAANATVEPLTRAWRRLALFLRRQMERFWP